MSVDLLHLKCERDAVRACLDHFLKVPSHEVPKPVLEDVIGRLEKLDASIAKQLKKEADVTEEDLRGEFLESAKIRIGYQTLLYKVSLQEKKSLSEVPHADAALHAGLSDNEHNCIVNGEISQHGRMSHSSHMSHHSKHVQPTQHPDQRSHPSLRFFTDQAVILL